MLLLITRNERSSRGKISDAARELMVLSNSFFTPYNCPEMTENGRNSEIADRICNLLGVIKKSSS